MSWGLFGMFVEVETKGNNEILYFNKPLAIYNNMTWPSDRTGEGNIYTDQWINGNSATQGFPWSCHSKRGPLLLTLLLNLPKEEGLLVHFVMENWYEFSTETVLSTLYMVPCVGVRSEYDTVFGKVFLGIGVGNPHLTEWNSRLDSL